MEGELEGAVERMAERLGVLLGYMVVMGWVETDLFAHNAPAGDAVRRITARGLAVVGEA